MDICSIEFLMLSIKHHRLLMTVVCVICIVLTKAAGNFSFSIHSFLR